MSGRFTTWDWGPTVTGYPPVLKKSGLWEQAWGPAEKTQEHVHWAHQGGCQGGCWGWRAHCPCLTERVGRLSHNSCHCFHSSASPQPVAMSGTVTYNTAWRSSYTSSTVFDASCSVISFSLFYSACLALCSHGNGSQCGNRGPTVAEYPHDLSCHALCSVMLCLGRCSHGKSRHVWKVHNMGWEPNSHCVPTCSVEAQLVGAGMGPSREKTGARALGTSRGVSGGVLGLEGPLLLFD